MQLVLSIDLHVQPPPAAHRWSLRTTSWKLVFLPASSPSRQACWSNCIYKLIWSHWFKRFVSERKIFSNVWSSYLFIIMMLTFRPWRLHTIAIMLTLNLLSIGVCPFVHHVWACCRSLRQFGCLDTAIHRDWKSPRAKLQMTTCNSPLVIYYI